MKFFIIRKLKILIGLTIVTMLYLSFKMHSGGNNLPLEMKGKGGFHDVIKNFFSGGIGRLFVSTLRKELNITRPRPRSVAVAERKDVPTKAEPFTPSVEFRSYWKKTSYQTIEPLDFAAWRLTSQKMCDDLIIGYNSNFLMAYDMVLDKSFCKCEKSGGESIDNVMMQAESEEYFRVEFGCFQSKCSTRPYYSFDGTNHLNDWMMSLSSENFGGKGEDRVVDEFTIAITRYEYANVYHTMTDWYNAFLVKEFFNRTSFDTNILIFDAHPTGSLDGVWSRLFNSTVRLSALPPRTRFKNLAWGIMGYNSPMGIRMTEDKLPLYEEFRRFFLDSYGIKEEDLTRHECKSFNVLFIWRHDYVAHPRNPKGTIARKIANEMELMSYMRQKLPSSNFHVKGSQIDVFDTREQLKLITWADILIGMHGAGLTYTVFLKKSSALIELTPNYMFGEQHFAAIAKWRGVVYNSWANSDPLREMPDKFTIVPPSVVLTLVKKSVKDLCNLSAYHALFPTTNNSSSTQFNLVSS